MSEPMQVTDEMREREKLFAAAMRKIQEGVTPVIMTEVIHERIRQEVKWGEQNHEVVGDRGDVTWADILIKKVAATLEGETEDEQRIELIHVAAVAVAAIEAIDRRRQYDARRRITASGMRAPERVPMPRRLGRPTPEGAE
jgi:hypothetical protein